MKDTKPPVKDPVCGMSVGVGNGLQAVRNGKTYYFCSEHCRETFLKTPAGAKPEDHSGSCCG